MADSPILPQLREALDAHFNRDEIIDLVFGLGLDHEKWPDKGKPGLIRELLWQRVGEPASKPNLRRLSARRHAIRRNTLAILGQHSGQLV